MSLTLPWLNVTDAEFPDIDRALTDPPGLLAAGGDLGPERLLRAYSLGIFPWYGEGDPVLWWSPDPRMVLFPDELHISRSLAKLLARQPFRITLNQAFADVLLACAASRRDGAGTWITPAMRQAYARLHDLGYAHSVEVWNGDQLVGGIYGVAMGKVFFGESMFSRAANASKVALVHLVKQLESWGYELIDCQVASRHLASLGAREIPRHLFQRHLPGKGPIPPPDPWHERWIDPASV